MPKFTIAQHNTSYPSANPGLYYYPSEERGGMKHMLSSTAVHGALIALTFLIQVQKPEIENIEIELLETPTPIIRSAPVAAGPSEVARPVAKSAPAPKAAARAQAPKPAAAPVQTVSQPVEAIEPSPLDTDDFETSLGGAVVEANPEMQTEDLDSDFDAINEESSREALAAKESFDTYADSLTDESDVTAQNLKKSQAETTKAQQAAAAAARRSALVKELAQSRAQAAAKQRALAAEEAARARAAQAAAEKAAAARAAQAAAARSQGSSKNGNTGNGNGGSGQAAHGNPRGTAVSGFAGGVRSLDQLKQMPGNKKPSYDVDDRMARRQGEVTLFAYVSRDGGVAQMRMLKSSGHQALDRKTIQAVQTWKFFPGQEGWVEIPIRWDLKGGPQEKPTTLRRRVTSS